MQKIGIAEIIYKDNLRLRKNSGMLNVRYSKPLSSLVREGNKAVPVQPMYLDVEKEL